MAYKQFKWKLPGQGGYDRQNRDIKYNMFHKTTCEIKTGEVYTNHPEPTFSQNMVSVTLSQGGVLPKVGIPGGFISPETGNLHGIYEGLIHGQMVRLGFIGGELGNPIIINRYPYQGRGNTLTEGMFINPMFKAGYSYDDVLMGHFSGSVIGLYSGKNSLSSKLPGSIGIDAASDCDITSKTNILIEAATSAEVKSELIKITANGNTEIKGKEISLNGSGKSFVTWEDLNTALSEYVSQLNTALRSATYINASGASTLITWVSTPPVQIDISAAQTQTIKTDG